MKPAYAERGWDYFTRTGAITRDMSINEPGLGKVIEAQKSAGLVGEGVAVEPRKYVDGSYLEQARKTKSQ